MAFRAATFWDLLGTFAKNGGTSFQAEMVSFDGRRIPEQPRFRRGHRPAEGPEPAAVGRAGGRRARRAAAGRRVARRQPGRQALHDPALIRRSPPARCNRRPTASTASPPGTPCRWPKASTRTGTSPTCEPTRPRWPRWRSRRPGNWWPRSTAPNTCPPSPRVYQTKVKNAQEAHEAIRPAGHPFAFPESLRGRLSPDEFKLYDLVWKRTVASQMADARGHRVTITIEAEGAVFAGRRARRSSFPAICGPTSKVRTIRRPIWPTATWSCRRSRWARRSIACRSSRRATPRSRPIATAKPRSTRALEEMGIGRPSTYASIIDTILARDYVFKLKRGNVLVPTWTAFAVAQLLGSPLARPGRLPVHRRDGRRAGRHQPRRNEVTSTICGRSISATSISG